MVYSTSLAALSGAKLILYKQLLSYGQTLFLCRGMIDSISACTLPARPRQRHYLISFDKKIRAFKDDFLAYYNAME